MGTFLPAEDRLVVLGGAGRHSQLRSLASFRPSLSTAPGENGISPVPTGNSLLTAGVDEMDGTLQRLSSLVRWRGRVRVAAIRLTPI